MVPGHCQVVLIQRYSFFFFFLFSSTSRGHAINNVLVTSYVNISDCIISPVIETTKINAFLPSSLRLGSRPPPVSRVIICRRINTASPITYARTVRCYPNPVDRDLSRFPDHHCARISVTSTLYMYSSISLSR